MVDFKFPDVGEGITEREIVKRRVKEGDKVKQDQVLVEVETDKAVVQLPSPEAGIIVKIYHKEGDTIKVGEVLVTIGGKTAVEKDVTKENKLSKEISKIKKKEKPKTKFKKPAKKDAGSVVGFLEEAPEADKSTEPTPLKVVPTNQETGAHAEALPAVRRLAKELGVDLEKTKGTGKDRRITEEDVRKAAEEQTQKEKKTEISIVKKYDLYGYIDHVPLKGMRKTIARRMVESVRASVHVTHTDLVDVTHLWEVREKEKKIAEKNKVHLTFLPYVIKALINALKEHPYLNATIDEEHEEIILKKYYNIGIAVDVEEGLIVPVIKVADSKDIYQLAKEIQELSEKARTRKIDLGDLQGGTFTITNIGSIGGLFATPIINQPEVAILALGKIYESPLVKEGKIVIRKVLPVSLTFDHRVVDGAEAARFTNTLKEYLEDPDLFIQ